MSNTPTINTKLYHDEESCKEPLFCGGDGEDEPEMIPLEGDKREKLIQKTYGLFAMMLLPQMIIVLLIAKATINCQEADKNPKAVDLCLKSDGLHQFYLNHKYLWINIVMTICAIAVVVCK